VLERLLTALLGVLLSAGLLLLASLTYLIAQTLTH
jgi:hypothetical protein